MREINGPDGIYVHQEDAIKENERHKGILDARLKRAEAIVRLARRHGVKALEISGHSIKVELYEQKPIGIGDPTPPASLQDDMPGDDELLYYSTEHFEAIRSDREEKA